MTAKITRLADVIVLLLYAKGASGQLYEPIRGRTRLVKMIFLFKKEILRRFNFKTVVSPAALPDFKPYNFGPFSAEVYEAIEFLVDNGFVDVSNAGPQDAEERDEYAYWQLKSRHPSDETITEQEFRISELGREFVDDGALGILTTEQWDIIHEFKKRCTSIPLKTLLRYIYAKYPEMTTESLIRDSLS